VSGARWIQKQELGFESQWPELGAAANGVKLAQLFCSSWSLKGLTPGTSPCQTDKESLVRDLSRELDCRLSESEDVRCHPVVNASVTGESRRGDLLIDTHGSRTFAADQPAMRTREGRVEGVCEGMKRRSTQPLVLDHVGPTRCDSRRIGE
jgi:hypothetical protein